MDNRPPHPSGSDRDPGSDDARAELVAAKLAARRRRVRSIRTRVAGLSVATLMATSGVVVVQMVTGNDPALAKAHTSSDVTAVADASTGTTASSATSTSHTSDARTTSETRSHTTRQRASSSKRAASTPTTVTTSAS